MESKLHQLLFNHNYYNVQADNTFGATPEGENKIDETKSMGGIEPVIDSPERVIKIKRSQMKLQNGANLGTGPENPQMQGQPQTSVKINVLILTHITR